MSIRWKRPRTLRRIVGQSPVSVNVEYPCRRAAFKDYAKDGSFRGNEGMICLRFPAHTTAALRAGRMLILHP